MALLHGAEDKRAFYRTEDHEALRRRVLELEEQQERTLTRVEGAHAVLDGVVRGTEGV